MQDKNKPDKYINVYGWALLLIWWGLRWSVLSSLPEGSGLLGTSLIFFGANAARRSLGEKTNPDNTFLGLFALLSGGVLFTLDVLNTSSKLPIFETLMVCLGVVLFGFAIYSQRRRAPGN